MTEFDTIVLGLGGLGSAALYWLSRRLGGDVMGIEQFETGHVRGGSQDHSRIIRLSYHTPDYVELAKQAYAAWRTLEAEAGEPLLLITGGLDISPANACIPISDYTRGMDAAGVAYETLDAREAMRRWPQFRLADDTIVLYQADAGIAPAAKGNAAHLRLARANGARILEQAPVSRIRPLADGVEIVAGGQQYRAGKLILAAGAWTNSALAHFGLHLPLEVTQEQVTYYASPRPEDFGPDRFPVWIWMDEPCFYGFPVYGEAGPKIGQDVGGRVVTAETRSFEPDPAVTARTEAFLREHLPGMLGPRIYSKTCLYTLTPDRDFIIDALPEHPNVFLAVGAGHAYKFAGLIGRILSELALDGGTTADISRFAVGRPILQLADPPRSYMV